MSILVALIILTSPFINEFAVQPTQYVEIINYASTSADISGWYIDDSGGSTYYTIPSGTVLQPFSCAVFTSSFNFNSTSSDIVRLFDSSAPPTTTSAHLIDSYTYIKAPSLGLSLMRMPDGESEWSEVPQTLGLWNTSGQSCIPPTPTLTPTPAPTSTVQPTQTPIPTENFIPIPIPSPLYSVLIDEIYPCPQTGENEYIVLLNDTDTDISLTNWYIDDAENTGSSPKLFSISISSHGKTKIPLEGSILNNSGDRVRILDEWQRTIDEFEYDTCKKGESIYRHQPDMPTPSILYLQTIIHSPAPTTTIKLKLTNTTQKAQKMYPHTPTKVVKQEVLGIVHIDGTNIQYSAQDNRLSRLFIIPFSYSILTIVSIFIKMRHA